MQVVRSLDKSRWRNFVSEHPQGNIFQTPEMFKVFSRIDDYNPELWAVVNSKGGVLALFLPVEITINKLFKSLTTRAIVYGSVLCDEGQDGKASLELLLRAYNREIHQPPIFTELRNLYDMNAVQSIFLRCGYKFEEHLNYLIDISRPVEEIFQTIGKRTRKNIRRGINQGRVLIEEVSDRKQLNASVKLIQDTYRLAKVPLAGRLLFEAVFDQLVPKGMARFTLASVDENPAAASVELLYKDVVYGWYSGLDRSYSSYNPNELLMWNILKWGAENGFQIYDFGGAGKPGEEYGVRDFKAKFGGDLVCFGRNTYIHRPGLFNLSKAGYRVYQSLKGLG